MSARSLAIDGYLLFGRLAVKYKHLSPEQLKKAIQQHEKAIKAGKTWRLGEVCVRLKMLSKQQCQEIVAKQEQATIKNEGSYFGYLSLVNGFVNKEHLAKVLKEQKKIKKQGKEPPRLGELAVKHGLMTEGQIQAILSAQMRLRDRLAKEAGTAVDITQSGRIPVVGDRAAEALKRLAEYEASLGTELEVEITSDDAVAVLPEPVDGMALPAPPPEFTRTVSTDDIEVHAIAPEPVAPSDQMFNSAATAEPADALPLDAEPVAMAEPIAPARKRGGSNSNSDRALSSGLQLDGADEVEIAPAGGGSAIPAPPPPPPPPAAGEPAAATSKKKKKKKKKKAATPAAEPVATASESAEGNLFAAATAPAAKPVMESDKPSPAAAKSTGTNATAAQAADKATQHFRGRRAAAPGESAEFKPPVDRSRVTLFIILGVAGAIIGTYIVVSSVISGM